MCIFLRRVNIKSLKRPSRYGFVCLCVYVSIIMFYVIYINISILILVDCPLLCQHEKYTSQLQMGIKSTESKQQNLQEDRSKLEHSECKSLTGESDQE